MKTPLLSKSRFITGQQCHLRLWYQCYQPELTSEISEAQQAIFDSGHEVGELATRLYPGGVSIVEDHLHHEEAVQSTLKAMNDSKVRAIYEAAFLYDGIRIRVDILERLEAGKWNLIEVKSSTSVKDVHFPDVAVQWYVLRGAGQEIDKSFLMHVNNQYVYDGKELNLNTFFICSDVTKEVVILQVDPQFLVEGNIHLLGGSPPIFDFLGMEADLLRQGFIALRGSLTQGLSGGGGMAEVILGHEIGVGVIVHHGGVLIRPGDAVDAKLPLRPGGKKAVAIP